MIKCHSLKKITVINKIVPDFMDTLYSIVAILEHNQTKLSPEKHWRYGFQGSV